MVQKLIFLKTGEKLKKNPTLIIWEKTNLGTKISRAVTNLATEDKLTITLYSAIANRKKIDHLNYSLGNNYFSHDGFQN